MTNTPMPASDKKLGKPIELMDLKSCFFHLNGTNMSPDPFLKKCVIKMINPIIVAIIVANAAPVTSNSQRQIMQQFKITFELALTIKPTIANVVFPSFHTNILKHVSQAINNEKINSIFI